MCALQKVNVFWFRRDLRLNDNIGLNKALQGGLPVLPVFIFDKDILDKLRDKRDRRVSFIHRYLKNINEELNAKNSSIKVFHGKPLEAFKQLSDNFQINAVYTNHDYEPYAIKRDQEIADFCKSKGIGFLTFKDQVIFEKSEVVKPDGLPYTVYTPYSNKWKQHFELLGEVKPEPLSKGDFLPMKFDFPRLSEIGFSEDDFDFPELKTDEQIIKDYHKFRDYPYMDKTSKLSVHLRFGTISIRALAVISKSLNEKFLNELIWREFFMQILYHFPRIVNEPFKERFKFFPWRNNEQEFELWKKGETGYPLIDAGMRELNETGFMHNRVRMVVANFLTKILLIDWRWGEAYFAEKLLDYELSSNNGNWQWAAGCGCDAAPFFRIFNPMIQIDKFDPEFIYIKKHITNFNPGNYIPPVTDYKLAVKRANDTYKSYNNDI
jgi:deoxyribodipyrimidine photo-lyase